MKSVLLLILYTCLLNAVPLSLNKLTDFHPEASVNIVVFYAPWCPPCKHTLAFMNELSQKDSKLHISLINVENPYWFHVAKALGMGETIPYIVIADQSGTIVKRFEEIPNRSILNSLIERLKEGRLENGTLPIDKRVDTWKMNRKGM